MVGGGDVAPDWHGCKSVGEMSRRQFAAWVDAGKPELQPRRRRADSLEKRLLKEREFIAKGVGGALADTVKEIEQRLRAELAVRDMRIADLEEQLTRSKEPSTADDGVVIDMRGRLGKAAA